MPSSPGSIAGVPLSQALPGYLITAPPFVCVPGVLGALAETQRHRGKKKCLKAAKDIKKNISLKLETQVCTTNPEIPPRKADIPNSTKLRIGGWGGPWVENTCSVLQSVLQCVDVCRAVLQSVLQFVLQIVLQFVIINIAANCLTQQAFPYNCTTLLVISQMSE